jgi:uncharacterized protein
MSAMQTQMLSVEMEASECESRLASARVGRLGVIVDGRPEIFPVHHAFDASSRTIVFQTNDRTKVDAARHWPTVAFEADGTSGDDPWDGWSVLVVGRAEEITEPVQIADMARLLPTIWAPSDDARWVRIIPEKITGRIISRRHTDDHPRPG